MLDTLEVGIRLSLEPELPKTDVREMVAALLHRPLLMRISNFGAAKGAFSESQLDEVIKQFQIPSGFADKLKSSRIVAYGEWSDRYHLGRVAFVYYNDDGELLLTEIQEKIPHTIRLTREWVDDTTIVDMFFESGFVPYILDWKDPLEEEA